MIARLISAALLAVVPAVAFAQQSSQQDSQAAALMLLGNCNVKEAMAASQIQQLNSRIKDLEKQVSETKPAPPGKKPSTP